MYRIIKSNRLCLLKYVIMFYMTLKKSIFIVSLKECKQFILCFRNPYLYVNHKYGWKMIKAKMIKHGKNKHVVLLKMFYTTHGKSIFTESSKEWNF